ncbi:MAG: energy-coupling factor ABC transporter ATP-binding protein [bacterium]
MLEALNIRFSYDGINNVLDNIDLTLAPGQRIGIYGANGTGKTTLARLLAGLLRPSEGAVRIDGIETDKTESLQARLNIALVFQDPNDQIVETSVEREIAFGLRNLGLREQEIQMRIDESLRLLGIEGLRKRKCESLSAGEKQLLNIASAFAMKPSYIILDEPTALLDSHSRKVFFVALESVLEKSGAGLILISGRMEEIFFCTHVGLLRRGSFSFFGERMDFLNYLIRSDITVENGVLLFKKVASIFPQAIQNISQVKRLDYHLLADCIENLKKDQENKRLGDQTF